jgi:hypothetical protein
MAKNEIQNLLDTFADGSGYGDPDARRNAELRLQTLLAREQQRIASRLNLLTFFLAVVGISQVIILAFQVWHK